MYYFPISIFLFFFLISSTFPLLDNFPSIDIFSPNDDLTLKRLVDYLEDFYHKNELRKNVSCLFFGVFFI